MLRPQKIDRIDDGAITAFIFASTRAGMTKKNSPAPMAATIKMPSPIHFNMPPLLSSIGDSGGYGPRSSMRRCTKPEFFKVVRLVNVGEGFQMRKLKAARQGFHRIGKRVFG